MATINDLDFTLVYHAGSAKITRVSCNFLIHDPVTVINQWWVNADQTFYTDVSIEYQGRTLATINLSNPDSLSKYFDF
jgi:hypothetical protein